VWISSLMLLDWVGFLLLHPLTPTDEETIQARSS
jgi:hypothetical protein